MQLIVNYNNIPVVAMNKVKLTLLILINYPQLLLVLQLQVHCSLQCPAFYCMRKCDNNTQNCFTIMIIYCSIYGEYGSFVFMLQNLKVKSVTSTMCITVL